MIEITGMRTADRQQVYGLMNELEGEQLDCGAFDRAFDAYMDDPDVHCVVVREDGRAIGFASVHVRMLMHHAAPVAELQELIVGEAYRGKGLGKQLLETAKRIAQINGSPQLEVCCNVKNVAGQAFYQRCGMGLSHKKYLWKPELSGE